MSFLSGIAHAFLDGIGPLNERSSAWDYPPLDEQLKAIQRRNTTARPWRPAGVNEALGVPAILSAVSLISNTVGTLTLEAFAGGQLVTDLTQIPQLIMRPNPRSTPRVFFRDTAFYLATRGEAWWWVARRDPRDNTPLSLYPVPPWEVQVNRNERDVLNPEIRWNDRVIANDDMRHITYLPDATTGRGKGPLQLAGAAVSVSVEADTWAANFYSGAMPSIIGTTDQELDENELLALDRQWSEKPNNLPRWLSMGIKMDEPPYDAQKAQLIESRMHQVGEAARMFSIPGSLIEYQMAGTSLRYRNDETIWTDFQRRCLSPHYLEPIEQEMSDLLTRQMRAEFNLEGLLRADPKTRAEVYEKLVPIGVMLPEEARRKERLTGGNSEVRPTPASPPRAAITDLPYERSAHEVRCPNGHLLAEMASPPYRFTCFRCKTPVAA